MAYQDHVAVETFAKNGLSDQQARVQMLRMSGLSVDQIARDLQIETGTVKSHINRIESKLDDGSASLLPDISQIETRTRVGSMDRPAVVIWFNNDTAIRYVYYDDKDEIVEQTYQDGVVHDSYEVGGSRDELAEYALETVSEYINTYRDDPDALRTDWPSVFEGVLGISA